MFTFQTYIDWQGNLILTTVSTTGLALREIKFPAISICGLGSVDSVMAERLKIQVGNPVQY